MSHDLVDSAKLIGEELRNKRDGRLALLVDWQAWKNGGKKGGVIKREFYLLVRQDSRPEHYLRRDLVVVTTLEDWELVP